MSKKTGGGNDVEKQRVRLQRAGFDKNVIDLMVQAHIEKSGGHLSIKDHILQLGRVWAEDMDVLEKPTMTELMTRTSTVLGTGTELFQSYLVHRAAPHRLCRRTFRASMLVVLLLLCGKRASRQLVLVSSRTKCFCARSARRGARAGRAVPQDPFRLVRR